MVIPFNYRFRERMKSNHMKQSSPKLRVLSGEGEKEGIYWREKKRESRARRSGRKIRREREKDREYRKDARSAPEKDKFIITKFTNGDHSRKYILTPSVRRKAIQTSKKSNKVCLINFIYNS